MNHNIFYEYFGMAATLCTVISFIPQLVMILKTRSTKGLSLGMYVLNCIGLVLWITYGILIQSFSLIVANVLIFIIAFATLYFKIIWRHQ